MGKSIIIILLGYLFIFNIIARNMNESSKEAEIKFYGEYSYVMAQNIANSAINTALYKISMDRNWNAGYSNQAMLGGTVNLNVISRLDIDPNALEIKSYSSYNGYQDSSSVVFYARTVSNRFSRFSYFSNSEPTIWFYSADTLYGPVHTNGSFHMSGNPTFFGMVSSQFDPILSGGANPQYLGGTDFGCAAVVLPTTIDALRDAALAAGHVVFGSVLRLVFLNDGTYNYKVGNGAWQNRAISSTNGVIWCNKNVFVSGVVNGQITVASTKDIKINGDILCSDDPAQNPNSDDLIGLVGMSDVKVMTTSDTRIQATMLAVQGSFMANNIYFTPTARLELYGGIIQETRGAVGTLSPSGFEKYYLYDERMESIFPPYFPIAGGAVSGSVTNSVISIINWIE